MSIICATHFTPSSLDAVAVATGLADRTRQKLHLVAVMPAGSGPTVDHDANAALTREAATARERGVNVETSVLHGKLEHQLSTLCRQIAPRLLVIGDTSRPMSPLFATPIDRISGEVAVPILVVKSRLPFTPWTHGDGPLRVLLAVDHAWNASRTRVWLQQLSAFGPLDVLATHIWSPVDEASRQGVAAPTDALAAMWAERLQRTTEMGLRGLPDNVRLEVRLEVGRGHIGRLLLDLASRERRDLLVLGTHPHGLLGRLTSVSHEVLAEGAQSVALIPQRPVEQTQRVTKATAVEARH